MKLGTVTKQPAERLSYTFNYEKFLTDGDNIHTAVGVAEPAGLTVEAVTVLDPRVRFWLSGGVDGVRYKVTITSNTADGRVIQDELTVKVKEF
jgi:hypothetical protein